MAKQSKSYEWSPSATARLGIKNLKPAEARSAAKALDAIKAQTGGQLKPKTVVEKARDPRSALHRYFEWDDTAAAERFRIEQARDLVQCVYAVYKEGNSEPVHIRAFVHVPEPGNSHYQSTETALAHKNTRQLVLETAKRELEFWRRRYGELVEFAELVVVVDETLAALAP